MTTHDEILFGRIAVISKLVTEEQIDECIKIQEERIKENANEHVHLGSILVAMGHLKEREKRAILMVQKENLQRRETGTNSRRQERIFGYLVMRLGFCTEQQVYECVREQARLMRFNLFFRLGEVFVSKKFLTYEQVKEILALQGKFIVTCDGCKTKFNVVRYQAGSKVKCPECAEIIEVPDILHELKQDNLFQSFEKTLDKNEDTNSRGKAVISNSDEKTDLQLGISLVKNQNNNAEVNSIADNPEQKEETEIPEQDEPTQITDAKITKKDPKTTDISNADSENLDNSKANLANEETLVENEKSPSNETLNTDFCGSNITNEPLTYNAKKESSSTEKYFPPSEKIEPINDIEEDLMGSTEIENTLENIDTKQASEQIDTENPCVDNENVSSIEDKTDSKNTFLEAENSESFENSKISKDSLHPEDVLKEKEEEVNETKLNESQELPEQSIANNAKNDEDSENSQTKEVNDDSTPPINQ